MLLRFSFSRLLLSVILLIWVGGCSLPPQVMAQDRMFLDLSLEFLDSYELPDTNFKDTVVGGLSALTYDRTKDVFYVLSDDRSNRGDARFYTMKLDIKSNGIKNITVESITLLSDRDGERYLPGTIDAEGIALSPKGTVFISSEGNPSKHILPFIGEFDLATGKQISDLRLPERFLAEENKGIQENLAFESLAIKYTGLAAEDPFRLFTATESSLIQDLTTEANTPIRLLHYQINSVGSPIIVAEHLYLLDQGDIETISNGLTELITLDEEGYFLSLERTFGFTGAGAKIFQVVTANASDTSSTESLKNITNIQPLRKELLLNLQDLGIYLDNLEGMTLGPRLPDGSQSLILVSDNNFNQEQITQFLLFRLSSH